MSNKEILQKRFTAEFGHDGHGEFMPYILESMRESNLRAELSFLYKYSERIGLDAETRIQEITAPALCVSSPPGLSTNSGFMQCKSPAQSRSR